MNTHYNTRQGSNRGPLLNLTMVQARLGTDAALLPFKGDLRMGHSHDASRKAYRDMLRRIQEVRSEEIKAGTPSYVLRALLRAERQAYQAEVGLVALTAAPRG